MEENRRGVKLLAKNEIILCSDHNFWAGSTRLKLRNLMLFLHEARAVLCKMLVLDYFIFKDISFLEQI